MGRITVTDAMPDLTGRSIDNGRLKLLESLGSGAYGKVYRALEVLSPLDKPIHYAVKCLLRPERGSHQEEFQDREINLHQMVCDHPNIVTLHRAIVDENYVYVILDLCAGGDLFTAITETQIFHNNVQLVKDSFVQLIDAVLHCHEKSVFHRDIKPENVLCSEAGADIRLADFGLSIQDPISTDFGCGSSYYMSPECIGKELSVGRYSTRHSDIWSLGVILTNMISGRNPWRYATTKDDCFAAYLHDRDFLRQVLPISHGANAILKRIFTINPLSRISLTDLREEILILDTFFMTEEEISGASPAVGAVAKILSEGKPRQATVIETDGDTVHGSTDKTDSSVSSDEVYAFDSPPDDSDAPSSFIIPSSAFLTVPGADLDTDSASPSARASGSTNSGSDSDGPITPATYPVDPAIEVPDFPEGEGLYQASLFPVSADPPKPTGSKIKKAFKRKRLIRLAFERIKGISSGSGSS
ncbi:serine/threonine protein kinase, negative regulator of sexual conjugation and meiosis [Lyophyllum atratum]|nr:serine/threonine protein kinase, negative regulator of sexual conjugation and meiosis [Lyophyllum atratum]